MRGSGRHQEEVPMRVSLLAVVLATVAATAPAALAADYQAGTPVMASPGSSPLPDPCPFQPVETAEQENFKDTEVEPLVAVNPTSPNHVIRVFQEDRWSDGGAHGLLAAVSFNGGRVTSTTGPSSAPARTSPRRRRSSICRARPIRGCPSTPRDARTRSGCRSSTAA